MTRGAVAPRAVEALLRELEAGGRFSGVVGATQGNQELLLDAFGYASRAWSMPATVEIREIIPPREVQDAMNRQLSAERTRRAVITESEGTRQSAINVAEGTKQSEILRAEGDRQAAILRAEGFALALTQIYNAASRVDQKTMAYQYLEAFKALGASPSTKYVLPLSTSAGLRLFSAHP